MKYCRKWGFDLDMNYDGLVSISDFWHLLEWLYFYPGDLLFYLISENLPELSRFFELSFESYSSTTSGIISLIMWPFVLVATFYVCAYTFIFVTNIFNTIELLGKGSERLINKISNSRKEA